MSVHLHTTISKKTADVLDQLTGTYGTKSRVLEKALETMLRVDKVGSCDDCAVKAQVEESSRFREALDLASVRKDLLDELLKIALGDQTIADTINRLSNDAQNVVELLRSSIQWKPPATFRDFLSILNQVSELTRLYDVASYREIDNTVVLRPILFTRVPELAAYQLAVILDGIGVPFDLRIMRKDILLKMLRKEVAALRRTDHVQNLLQRMHERLDQLKPQLFKGSLVLVGPAFLKWAAKNLEGSIADLGMVLEDFRLFLKPEELPDEPLEFLDALLAVTRNMNWVSQAKIDHNPDDSYRVSLQATSPSMASICTVAIALVLASHGWQLLQFSTEYDQGSLQVKHGKEESHDVLDQLVELNLFRVLNEQFLDTVAVPRDTMASLAGRVLETDRRKFEDIYHNMGVRVANAIRMLARGNPEKIQRFTQQFIVKNLRQSQPNAEIRFADDHNFSIVFKQMEPVAIASERLLVESMLKALGYEVLVTPFQNLLNVKMTYTEKPLLAVMPRSKVVQMLGDGMAADSLEEALAQAKPTLDELFPLDYPWTIQELGQRLLDMYRELGVQVEIEYFEGGFTLKYHTCPYYKLVKNNQKTWLCTFRKKSMEYILSRVSRGAKGRVKVIKSLIKNEHPCEYALFLTEFLETGAETEA
jgi:antitoxin component of RelBE/YafQ-DinJ toxin-antitoxin module